MKLKTPRLVVQHLEGFSGKVLDEYPEVVSEFIRGKNGVYALYKRDRLYYVGLARNLRSRLRMHMRDRHAGKWDRFSIYLTEGDEHLKELEALILRIAEPPGNKVTGKFIDSHDLRQDLRRRLKAAALRKIDEFTCWEEQTDISEDDSDSRLENKEHIEKCTISSGHTNVLAELISKPFYIKMEYKGKMYSAHVNKNGTISLELSGMNIKKWQRVKDMLFTTPSSAAKAATGVSLNGWRSWEFRSSDGRWVKLDELRKGRAKPA
ncbi:MAG: hypothetical protein ABIK51_06220 [candidate division WOR-3 bacterium]